MAKQQTHQVFTIDQSLGTADNYVYFTWIVYLLYTPPRT